MRTHRGLRLLALLFVTLAALSISVGCTSSSSKQQGDSVGKNGDLIIYSGRKEKLFLPVVRKFERETGINVLIKNGKTAELANAVLEEKNAPQADVFLAQEAGILDKLSREDVLLPYKPKNFDSIPEDFRSDNGTWIGVSGRSRVLMYNTDLVKEEDVPKSVLELSDPKWKGKLAMASSQEASVVGWVSSMRLLKGDDYTRNYLKSLIDNDIEVLENHTLIRKAVGKGEFSIGFVNHYYYHLEKHDGSPVAAVYPDQEEGGMGVLVNTAGVSIFKLAKNTDSAKKFVDFLITPEAQDQFAGVNFEYPTIPGVKVVEAKPFEEFKRTPIKLKDLGDKVDSSLDMLTELGID